MPESIRDQLLRLRRSRRHRDHVEPAEEPAIGWGLLARRVLSKWASYRGAAPKINGPIRDNPDGWSAVECAMQVETLLQERTEWAVSKSMLRRWPWMDRMETVGETEAGRSIRLAVFERLVQVLSGE